MRLQQSELDESRWYSKKLYSFQFCFAIPLQETLSMETKRGNFALTRVEILSVFSPARPHKKYDSVGLNVSQKRPTVTFMPSSGRSNYAPGK